MYMRSMLPLPFYAALCEHKDRLKPVLWGVRMLHFIFMNRLNKAESAVFFLIVGSLYF